MNTRAKNRLMMTKSEVAARRRSGSVDHESWVWVIPLQSGEFRIRAFEVRKELLINDNDIYDGNMSIIYDDTVASIAEIDRSVISAGGDPEELDAPWNCGFPL